MQWQRDLEEREWEIFNFHLQAELQQHSEEGLRHWFQMERLINPTGTPPMEEAGDKGEVCHPSFCSKVLHWWDCHSELDLLIFFSKGRIIFSQSMKKGHLNYLKFGTAVTQVISNTFAKFEADCINEWTDVTGNILL